MHTTTESTLAAAGELRQRRIEAAAHHRQVQLIRTSQHSRRSPSAPGHAVLARHRPRWLALP